MYIYAFTQELLHLESWHRNDREITCRARHLYSQKCSLFPFGKTEVALLFHFVPLLFFAAMCFSSYLETMQVFEEAVARALFCSNPPLSEDPSDPCWLSSIQDGNFTWFKTRKALWKINDFDAFWLPCFLAFFLPCFVGGSADSSLLVNATS